MVVGKAMAMHSNPTTESVWGVYMFLPHVHAFPPGTPVTSHFPKRRLFETVSLLCTCGPSAPWDGLQILHDPPQDKCLWLDAASPNRHVPTPQALPAVHKCLVCLTHMLPSFNLLPEFPSRRSPSIGRVDKSPR